MIIFDTDIASLFAKSDTIDLLFKILPNFSFAITVKIKEELSVPLQYGYSFPQEIFKQFITLVPTRKNISLLKNLKYAILS
ncbi:MAG: hypothetical protein HUU50_08365 [Candidatus Brocadiae bacterium]|nr:hypothetical protein [Candidatus Brocadiia bacterium]